MIENKPNDKIQKLIEEAENYHKSGHFDKLEKVLRDIISIDSNYFPAFFNLARLLEMSKKWNEAIKLYKKTLELNPSHMETMFNLINCYEDTNNLNQAIKMSEKICELYPNRFESHYAYGRLMHKQVKNIDKAYNAYKKTLSINNNFIFAKLGLGQISTSRGNFSEAKEIFQKVIESDKDSKAYYEIVDFLDKDEIEKNIKDLKILENDKKQTDINKIYLYFAMGKMYEKISNYNKAFHYFDLGNKLKNKVIGSIDFKWEEKKFEALKKTLKKFGKNKTKNLGYHSSKPIFIVGMPRSGSTLVEQIIASHSEVFGGGELFNFTDFFKKVDISKKNKNLIDCLDHINEENFLNIGKDYIEKIEKISKKNKYFTNKYLGNVFNILLIKLALPDAKIIHCERNALDTCLSCYKTNFTESNEYTYSLEGLGSYYLIYKEQIEYWNKIFTKQILNIKYENVVSDIKKETKKILDYLNLNFEKNCLEFYKNKRAIQTASLVQARKPVYKNSINSWMKYKDFLKPLTDKLNKSYFK